MGGEKKMATAATVVVCATIMSCALPSALAQQKDEKYWFAQQAKADAHEVDTFRGKDFNNREHYFKPTEIRRAHRYIQHSKKWLNEINKATTQAANKDEDNDDADGSGADTFMYEWLVSQQLLAALEFAPEEAD